MCCRSRLARRAGKESRNGVVDGCRRSGRALRVRAQAVRHRAFRLEHPQQIEAVAVQHQRRALAATPQRWRALGLHNGARPEFGDEIAVRRQCNFLQQRHLGRRLGAGEPVGNAEHRASGAIGKAHAGVADAVARAGHGGDQDDAGGCAELRKKPRELSVDVCETLGLAKSIDVAKAHVVPPRKHVSIASMHASDGRSWKTP